MARRTVQYKDTTYMISSDGIVYNKHGRELKQMMRKGYKYVDICHVGKVKHVSVHRMVAESFIPNPDNKPQVNHKDGDRTNNHDWNLEWATGLENMTHASRLGLTNNTAGAIAGSTKCSKSVVQLDINRTPIAEFASASEAHRVTGAHAGRICACCDGRVATVGGFKWRWGGHIG